MVCVDIKKAFDNVKWDKKFDILRKIRITFKEKQAISKLY